MLGEGVTAGGGDGDGSCRSSSAGAWSGGVRSGHVLPQAAVNMSAKADGAAPAPRGGGCGRRQRLS